MFFADLVAVLGYDGFRGWRRALVGSAINGSGVANTAWPARFLAPLGIKVPSSAPSRQTVRRVGSRCDELAGDGPGDPIVVDLSAEAP